MLLMKPKGPGPDYTSRKPNILASQRYGSPSRSFSFLRRTRNPSPAASQTIDISSNHHHNAQQTKSNLEVNGHLPGTTNVKYPIFSSLPLVCISPFNSSKAFVGHIKGNPSASTEEVFVPSMPNRIAHKAVVENETDLSPSVKLSLEPIVSEVADVVESMCAEVVTAFCSTNNQATDVLISNVHDTEKGKEFTSVKKRGRKRTAPDSRSSTGKSTAKKTCKNTTRSPNKSRQTNQKSKQSCVKPNEGVEPEEGPCMKVVLTASKGSFSAYNVSNSEAYSRYVRRVYTAQCSINKLKKPPAGKRVSEGMYTCCLCACPRFYGSLGELFGPYFVGFSEANASSFAFLQSTSAQNSPSSPTAPSRSKRRKFSAVPKRSGTSTLPKKSKSQVNLSQEQQSSVTYEVNDTSEIHSFSTIDSKEVELVYYDIWIHGECALWTPEIMLRGYSLEGVEECDIAQYYQQICNHCDQHGATVGCVGRRCKALYHFDCAKTAGCQFREETLSMLCPNHQEEDKTNSVKTAGSPTKRQRKPVSHRSNGPNSKTKKGPRFLGQTVAFGFGPRVD